MLESILACENESVGLSFSFSGAQYILFLMLAQGPGASLWLGTSAVPEVGIAYGNRGEQSNLYDGRFWCLGGFDKSKSGLV
jgi:hypothetical protein